ncbi:T9SS type A sorting domain-containing protein [Bernardetia sp. MNP-M8]|uniref:T9SS type A sorting domain-containing protein n=1 Tax=Bernardetia sp. MNP-M8 TaxID=3127470 RepID=UPI0030D3E06A
MRKILLFILFCLYFGFSSLSYGQFYPGGMGGGAMPFWFLPSQAYTTGVFPYPAPTNGNDVQIWIDNALVVGGSNDATQPTVARRPNYNNTGVYANASVRFDRANTEWLQMADDNSINSTTHDQKAMTLTFRANDVSPTLQFIYEEGGGTNGMGIYLSGNVLYVAIWNDGAVWPNVGGGSTLFSNGESYRFFRQTITANTDYLVTLLYDNNYTNTFRAFLNGTQMSVSDNIVRTSLPVGTFLAHTDDTGIGAVNGASKIFDITNASLTNTNVTPTTSGGTFFDGRIGEITYYNNGSNVARKIVENYFSTKYAFTLATDDMFPENPSFRSQMIGIGQETTNLTGDRISSNIQSSGGFFIQNIDFFKDIRDYVFVAHNSGVGTTPLGVGEYSNRLWLVEVTDINNNDGNLRVSFDLGGLSLASPACVNSADQYYLRINGVNTRLGAGTYNPVSQTITFVVPASEIDGAQITIGVNDTTVPLTEAGACNNGCDDDGDGLVDCYDGDCNGNSATPDPACDDYYYGQVPPDCVLPNTPDPDITTTIQFETDDIDFEVEQRGGVFIGDVVPDTWSEYAANGITGDDAIHAEVVAKNPYNTPYTAGPKNGQARSPHIYIYSGDDGQLLQQIPTPVTDKFSMLALGDVDRDGNGDIFVTGNDRRIYRFEFDPSVALAGTQPINNWVAQSSVLVGHSEMSPALADFDQNGVPEVYVGNAIYNAVTLANYIAPNNTLSSGNHPNDNTAAFPVAYDVFSPSDIVPATGVACGGDCQGLELVTGNRIYAVNLTAGTLTLLSSAPANITDGRASVADMDNDGRVDVVTCGYDNTGTAAGAIFIWNPRTQAQMGTTFKLTNGGQVTTVGGRPNLADIDGDRMLEIVVGGRNRLYAIETDSDADGFFGPALVLKWVGITDETSDRTSGSTFDFNGDGISEVIYSDEADVIIFNGATGAVVERVVSLSGTRSEYPIVADVDKDGLSELIVTSQNQNGPDDNAIGRVTVYASGSGSPWVSSRPVWNQHTYLITNVEDNLTIPSNQQNHIQPGYIAGPPAQTGPLNSFIRQVSSFDKDNNSLTPTGNLVITTIDATPASSGGDVDYSNCLPTGEIIISVTVTNDGDANLPASTPITFYDENPFSSNSNILNVLTLGIVLAPGATQTLSFSINVNGGNFNMYVLGNIDGNANPLPQYSAADNSIYENGECDYSDNGQPTFIDECLLPVELISLYAENLSKKVVVHWATATELDNDYFLVERAGEDLQFRAIGKVVGKGTRNERTDYLFNDYEPLLGTAYYRLKQVDYNGKWTNTKAVSVTRTTNNLPPALYPNPNKAGRELYMRGFVDASMIKQLRIMSITGQEVSSNIEVKSASDGIVVINLPKTLSKGIYILNIATDFGAENFKFMIE